MPALKPNTIFPTDEEDVQITAAALSDNDAMPLTDSEWEEVKPFVFIGELPHKERVAVSFDKEIINYFRATGSDWQSRMNDALTEWIREHAV
jgi:uncharacterized protein (DUF4415 family)